jgi:hypothetical protein
VLATNFYGRPTRVRESIPLRNAIADHKRVAYGFARSFDFKNVTVLHPRDRTEADSEEFVAPLKKARAVLFNGGRQWRIVDAFAGTLTQREIEAVLERGGVIGGSSAGATIQGSYLVWGAREGNELMMAKGYEQGFGCLPGVVIGRGVFGVYDGEDHDGKRYYFLAPGEQFDLKDRRRVPSESKRSADDWPTSRIDGLASRCQ